MWSVGRSVGRSIGRSIAFHFPFVTLDPGNQRTAHQSIASRGQQKRTIDGDVVMIMRWCFSIRKKGFISRIDRYRRRLGFLHPLSPSFLSLSLPSFLLSFSFHFRDQEKESRGTWLTPSTPVGNNTYTTRKKLQFLPAFAMERSVNHQAFLSPVTRTLSSTWQKPAERKPAENRSCLRSRTTFNLQQQQQPLLLLKIQYIFPFSNLASHLSRHQTSPYLHSRARKRTPSSCTFEKWSNSKAGNVVRWRFVALGRLATQTSSCFCPFFSFLECPAQRERD